MHFLFVEFEILLITFTLLMRLSQRVCNNSLIVIPEIYFLIIFYLFVEEENNEHRCYITPKKKNIALGQELATSQNNKLRLSQPHGV